MSPTDLTHLHVLDDGSLGSHDHHHSHSTLYHDGDDRHDEMVIHVHNHTPSQEKSLKQLKEQG